LSDNGGFNEIIVGEWHESLNPFLKPIQFKDYAENGAGVKLLVNRKRGLSSGNKV